MYSSPKRPVCWVLAAPGAGDNRQLATLVDLLDADARWVESVDPVGRVLRDRAFGFRVRRIPEDRRDRYAPPWPDLVLIAGGRSVIDARRIRAASGGRSKIVCLGRPWAPLGWFDLVVTTPQYRLPVAPNVVTLDLPLNLPPPVDEQAAEAHAAAHRELPRPWVGVLLGGDSGSFRFRAADAAALARALDRAVGAAGGGVIATASPRTPLAAVDALERGLTVPARVHRFGDADDPYGSLFAIADALVVTADSASMVAEACFSGRPVATFGLHERLDRKSVV